MNEKNVIRRCRSGDQEAFNELIRMYYPYVTGYLMKLAGDKFLCEDLTQETFLKMIKSIDRYDLSSSAGFGTYIITIARNTYIDHCRRERKVIVPLDYAEISYAGFEEEVITRLEYEQTVKLMETLPEPQREALRLKYIDRLTLKEIEAVTGAEQKTIKSRIFEGKKKLRKLLGKEKQK